MSKVLAGTREPLTQPLVLLAVSLLIGLSGNLIAPVYMVGSVAWKVLTVGSPILAFLMLSIYLVWYIRRPLRVELSRTALEKARPCKGLVLLVSPGRGSESAKAAIRYHAATLQHVWLVHSDTSKPDADRIIDELGQDGDYRGLFNRIPLLDINFENNPEAVRERIEEKVFRQLPDGIDESDVIIDITGGRKATTAGAFLAALPSGRRVEIVNPKRTDRRERGTEAGDPIEITIDYIVKRC